VSRVAQKAAVGPVLLPHVESLCNSLLAASGLERVFLVDTRTRLFLATDSGPLQDDTYELCAAALDVACEVVHVYDPGAGLQAALQHHAEGGETPRAEVVARAARAAARAADAGRCSASLVRLTGRTAVYAREVAPFLAALCVIDMPGDAEDGGDNEGAAGGGHGGGEDRLPRSALSLPFHALVDANVQVFARALGALRAAVDASAAAVAAAAAATAAAAAAAAAAATQRDAVR
jgi:hypothetical protein